MQSQLNQKLNQEMKKMSLGSFTGTNIRTDILY